MVQVQVQIINKLGLHARAAAKFVSLASRFQSNVQVGRNSRQVNGKSIMGVMMLAASCGSAIEITISGVDEQEALTELLALIENRFGETE
jgi:phosphocarrier protein HPr